MPEQKPTNPPKFGKTYTFRLRQHVGGNFSGLWESTLLNKMFHVEEVLADADGLTYCLENIQGRLEVDGF